MFLLQQWLGNVSSMAIDQMFYTSNAFTINPPRLRYAFEATYDATDATPSMTCTSTTLMGST